MIKPTRLRVALVGILLVVQIVTVGIFLRELFNDGQVRVSESAAASLDRLATNVTERTRQLLEIAQSAARLSANLVKAGEIDSRVDRELESYFSMQLEAHPQLDAMYFGRQDGSFVYVRRESDGVKTKIIRLDGTARHVQFSRYGSDSTLIKRWRDNADAYDPRVRPWYKIALDSNHVAWTDAYQFFTTGEPGISASVQVRDITGAPAGVVGIDIGILALSRYVAHMPGTRGAGAAIITDSRDSVIAYSNSSRLMAALSPGTLPNAQQLASPEMLALMSQPEAFNRDGPTAYSSGEGHYIGMKRELDLFGGALKWRLFAEAPEKSYSDGLLTFIGERLPEFLLVTMVPTALAVLAILVLTSPLLRLHEAATRDQMTGALRGAEFDRQLTEIVASRRNEEPGLRLVLAVIDLDHFKSINDQHGHLAGNTMLRVLVRRLKQTLRQADLIGRAGGDEFVIAMHIPREVDLMQVLCRLHQSITVGAVETPTGRLMLGATIGAAVHEPGEPASGLFGRADAALIAGKTQERNRCYIAQPTGSAGGQSSALVAKPVI